MRMAAKKEVSSPEEGTPQALQEAMAASLAKIEEALKSVPAEKISTAQKEVDRLMKGDLSWADFSQYTPEKLLLFAEMGYNQFTLGQYDSAEKIFKGLTVIDPENYYYHQMLGATFQRKDKLPEAIVEYTVAYDVNPNDIVSLTNRGEIYFMMGIYEMAMGDFDKAIGLDPKSEDKWANRARMLREQIKLVKKRKK